MVCDVGAPGLVMAAWVLAGALALCGALTLAELGAMIPNSGGPYAFLRRAFGAPIGFAYGWMMLFLGGPLSIAALAAGSAIFLNLLTGGSIESLNLPFAFMGMHGAVTGTRLAALALLAMIAIINLAPIRTNGAIATALAVVKILMLVALAVGAFAFGAGSFSHFAMSGNGGLCTGLPLLHGIAGFGAAMVGALYAYQGWSSLTYVAGEVKDPGRTLPRALVASIGVVITVYVAANLAYFYTLTPHPNADVSPESSVGLEVLGRVFGAPARGVATALLFISVLATLHVSILTNSRITFALADDDRLVPWLAKVAPGTHVPGRAVMVSALFAGVLVLLGTFDVLSDFLVFSVWVFFALTALALFRLRAIAPDADRPYRIAGYPWLPGAFVAVAVWLLIEAVVDAPQRSFIGLGIIALALPAYFLLRARRSRGEAAAISER